LFPGPGLEFGVTWGIGTESFARGAKRGQRNVLSMTRSDIIVTNANIAISFSSVNKSALLSTEVPSQSKKVPF